MKNAELVELTPDDAQMSKGGLSIIELAVYALSAMLEDGIVKPIL